MARGILGRSRSPSQPRSIAKPVSRGTNALPHNDLREFETSISYSRPINQVVKDGQRADTPEERNPRRKTRAPVPELDFRITNPSAEVVSASPQTDHVIDESMIGIALGSPRMLESQITAAQGQSIPPPTPPEPDRPPLSVQRKSSRWRKIGSLFKVKSAMAPNTNKPFYQVRAELELPSQGSSHSIDYKCQKQIGTRPEPIENTEVWPCLLSEQEAVMHKQCTSKPSAPESLLQVEIPKVEMERYSIMFGGLLNNNRPSLLNRRSKTLDDVTIPNREESTALGPPRRRATSPTGSRSPNFTLFPTTPTSKASKILGTQNLPRVPDPLRKAQSIVKQSSQDRSPATNSQSTLMVDNQLNAHPSHRSKASMASFLSSTSIDSDDDPLVIHRVQPVRTYTDMKEPNWEMVNRKTSAQSPQQNPSKKLTINTRELRSGSETSRSTTPSSPILSPFKSARPVESPMGNKNTPSAYSPSKGTYPPEEDRIPTIEVSVARSVSVSKGKKQVLVPVRTKTSRLNSKERLVARQARTPKVTGGQYTHRPGLSQDVRIEMA
ncbi:uncharacterized protein BJX67DRAFT_30617 [Aspergillus lucknowensis]|uniref:Uncharacterized protein n=1 Tax=Aspergillus lucknowensis TaxID=176173 RepID=A0ABR4LWQ2_9EURO